MVSIRSATDYSPFGVQLENRDFLKTGIAEDYSMGFQGQLEDDEIKGEGNSVNYKYRMHDPRLGRFFAIDPLAALYPWYTPYSFSGNKVINSIELEGLEEFTVIQKGDVNMLIWDISARDRKGEAGAILYVNEAGNILQEMRSLNETEANLMYFQERLKTEVENAQHLSGGTTMSGGRPSTGLIRTEVNPSTGEKRTYIAREAFVNSKSLAPPPPPEKTIEKEIKIAKKTLSSSTKAQIETKMSEVSITAYTHSGSSITPIINKNNDGFGNVKDLAKELSSYEFKSIEVNLSIGYTKNKIFPATTPEKHVENLRNEIVDGLVKSGIPRSKITGSAKVNYSNGGRDAMQVTIKQ